MAASKFKVNEYVKINQNKIRKSIIRLLEKSSVNNRFKITRTISDYRGRIYVIRSLDKKGFELRLYARELIAIEHEYSIKDDDTIDRLKLQLLEGNNKIKALQEKNRRIEQYISIQEANPKERLDFGIVSKMTKLIESGFLDPEDLEYIDLYNRTKEIIKALNA